MLELAARESLPVVVVNPAAPVGPRDIKPTPTGKMVLDTARGRVPAYIDTGLNIVHVDDVAEGHALALERGRIGERYVLGGENMLLKDVLALIADVAGQRPPRIRLPEALIWPVAWAMEKTAPLTGIAPMMTRDHLKMARKKMFYSSAKAEAELGYKARPAREAVVDAVAWFRADGMLRSDATCVGGAVVADLVLAADAARPVLARRSGAAGRGPDPRPAGRDRGAGARRGAVH